MSFLLEWVVEMPEEKIAAYLQRLTGNVAGSDVRLTSAQKSAFAAWLRREGVAFSVSVLQRPAFQLQQLLGGAEDAREAERPKTASPQDYQPLITPGSAQAVLSRLKIGIDLEHVTSIPDALDFREHEFYRENFTAREIAYCLQRSDPKKSLCGLWAAKEAIVKALGKHIAIGSRIIEIDHDAEGRPRCELGALSISHAGDFCVAVFVSV